MTSQIVAEDTIFDSFGSVRDTKELLQIVVAAHGCVVGLVGVTIGVNLGIVAKEYEQVGVAAVGKGELGVLAEVLMEGGVPGFGALPGIVVAVKLIRAEGTVERGQENSCRTQFRAQDRFGGAGGAAIFAVIFKSVGKSSLERELLEEGTEAECEESALRIGSEAADGASKQEFSRLRYTRDDV